MSRAANLRVAVLQNECETGLGALAGLLGEAGVRCEPYETHDKAVLPDAGEIDGVIALGGSMAADDPALFGTRRWIRGIVLRDVPFFGVCLGGQLLAAALGGVVGPASPPEVGVHDVFLTNGGRHDPLFGDLPGRFRVFGWHEDAFELHAERYRWPVRSLVSIKLSASARTPTESSSTRRCGQPISGAGLPYRVMPTSLSAPAPDGKTWRRSWRQRAPIWMRSPAGCWRDGWISPAARLPWAGDAGESRPDRRGHKRPPTT